MAINIGAKADRQKLIAALLDEVCRVIACVRRPGGTIPNSGRLRHAYTSLTFFSGRLRTGLPVAAWIALSTAGDTTEMVGSPMPPQKS